MKHAYDPDAPDIAREKVGYPYALSNNFQIHQ